MNNLFKPALRGFVTNVGTRNDAEREEWVKSTLSRLPAGIRLLDAGAGQQRYRRYCPQAVYVSQDFCQYTGGGDYQALQTGTWDTRAIDIISDIAAIPQPDGSFDVVLCTEVIEHVPDPLAALREFRRLLRPGGELISRRRFAALPTWPLTTSTAALIDISTNAIFRRWDSRLKNSSPMEITRSTRARNCGGYSRNMSACPSMREPVSGHCCISSGRASPRVAATALWFATGITCGR